MKLIGRREAFPQGRRHRLWGGLSATACAAMVASSLVTLAPAPAGAVTMAPKKQIKVALILKDFINPYWIFMAKAATAEAAKLGILLQTAAGTSDSDTTSQISAIDVAIAAGDQGIIISPNGPGVDAAINQAKRDGIYVLAVDTVPTPAGIVELTYATNNTLAGQLIGKYAAKRLNGQTATIAVLDDVTNEVISVDVDRDHGFLEGMGIPVGKPNINGFEPKSGHYTGGKGGTYSIACQLPTQGTTTGGQSAMETCLAKNPDINLVYAINEPAAEGAVKALQDAHKKGVIVVTIDGSCANLPFVKSGEIAATAGQFPGKMADLGIEAIYNLVTRHIVPKPTPGLNFYNTGTIVYTNTPVAGVPSINTTQAQRTCWG
ncbi:MAG: substrate-binding domain-containing protein [Acidimicrobiales bacterium]